MKSSSLLLSTKHQSTPIPSTSRGVNIVPSVHSVRPGQHFVTVHTLRKHVLTVTIDSKTRVHDVLWACGEQLQVNDDRFFGLALRSPSEGIGGDQPRNEYFFLDPAHKIFKYSPTKQSRFAQWTSSSSSRADNRPFLVLYYRVRVYIDEVRLITCQRALEHYYTQLRENLLDQWSTKGTVAEERIWEMAALALRADKENNDFNGYFRAEQYFPLWVINERGLEYIRKHMPAAMIDLQEKNRQEAMTQFCVEASRSPFALNCHLYGLRRHKMDSRDNAVIGVTALGIEICDVIESGERIPLRLFPWGRVTKLQFDCKRISINSMNGENVVLYAQNESKARYLLDLCRAVHQCLLVVQHSTAGPRQLPNAIKEKSVDGTDRQSEMSNSTTSGVISDRQSQTDRQSTTRRNTEDLRQVIDADFDSLRHSLSTTASERSDRSRLETERKKRRVGKGRIVMPVETITTEIVKNEQETNEEKDDTLKADVNWQEEMAEWEKRDQQRNGKQNGEAEEDDDNEEDNDQEEKEEEEEEEVIGDDEERISLESSRRSISRESAQSMRGMNSCAVQTESPMFSHEISHRMSPLPSRPLDPHYSTYPSYLSSQSPPPRSFEYSNYPSSSSGIQTGKNSFDLLTDIPRSFQYEPSLNDSTTTAQSSSLIDSNREPTSLISSSSSNRNRSANPPAYFDALAQQKNLHQHDQLPHRHPSTSSSPRPRWSTGPVSPEQVRQSVAAIPNYLINTNSESRIDAIEMFSMNGTPSMSSHQIDQGIPRGNAGGRFAKRPSRHNNTAISRVQSMPPHYHINHHQNQQQSHQTPSLQGSANQTIIQPLIYRTPLEQTMIGIPGAGLSQSASSLYPLHGDGYLNGNGGGAHLAASQPQLNSHQLPNRTEIGVNRMKCARDPPSYERATSHILHNFPTQALQLQRCGVASEARGQPSFPPPSITSSQFAPPATNHSTGEIVDSNRFQDLPMLRALWAESQQTRTSLESSTSSSSTASHQSEIMHRGSPPLLTNNHNQRLENIGPSTRRPISMVDLSQADPMLLLYPNAIQSGSYVLDSGFTQAGFSTGPKQGYNMSWSSNGRVVDLPPPPPYPETSRQKPPMVVM
ncbi:unnamed protein product, partial [Mesorhabditis belari]|uniref:FERM domain-containing protein n=1 Tax=Mesorhabditis belari TaxID=2138241 RepID=A0AAF3EWA9_9BILA